MDKEKDKLTASRDAANMKLTIFLGLVAFAIYVGFLWFYIG